MDQLYASNKKTPSHQLSMDVGLSVAAVGTGNLICVTGIMIHDS